MRLSTIILAVSAVTLVAGVNALCEAANVDQAMVMPLTYANSVSEDLNNADGKRYLRSSENEERLGGANMFNIKKLEDALNDTTYAKTLFRRWKRSGVNEDTITTKFKNLQISLDENALELIQSYRIWLNAHATKTNPKLFDRAKIKKALEDGTYANVLYGRWKRYGFESDDVFKRFQRMGVNKDDNLYQVYKNYVTWLNVHHPLKKSTLTTPEAFLFYPSRIQRAKSDPAFAETLFAKWKSSGLDEGPVYKKLWDMGLKKDNAIYKLYTDYVLWLDKHFPLPAKATN
ncbi:secreted RxLR effector peptide protein, putative [Phytophthora infestans T30-4]|uniref:RxLR effector protein n=2 Tax=Phytophthora infestans TaxID=4787 RepID=D0N8N7_PHYIT|nr:secreted RxLR effector peptide protein, putative [Phytophthora infestans T30-4]EEY53922.1 secreted RxLR effector peptide protein, putative [Phytophthora infestans T30-4]KAF4037258.1 RXLR domain-containing protein [Phytophthora infestans]|eukprot:XP_002904553.1 secreted RxLR effector peptide protein, putative [Phytophthora infestans T30-4]